MMLKSVSHQIIQGLLLVLTASCTNTEFHQKIGSVSTTISLSSTNNAGSMFFEQSDISLLSNALRTEADKAVAVIRYREKFDSRGGSQSQVSYFDIRGNRIPQEDPPTAYVKPEFRKAILRIRDALAMGGDPFTHIELIFHPDGKYDMDLGYGPVDREEIRGFWPDDITADVYTYSRGWE